LQTISGIKKARNTLEKALAAKKSFNVFKGQKVKESKQITMDFLNCNLSEERLRCAPGCRRGTYLAQIDNPAGTTGKTPRHPTIPVLPFENLHLKDLGWSGAFLYNAVPKGNMGEINKDGHLKHNYLEVALEQIVEDFASVIISDGEIPSWINDEADIDFIRRLRQNVQALDTIPEDIEAIVPGWTKNWDEKQAEKAIAKAKNAEERKRKCEAAAAARAAKRGARYE